MNAIEIIEKWNEYCDINSYEDLVIYTWNGFGEFLNTHHCETMNVVSTAEAELAYDMVRGRGDQEFYAFKDGKVVWLTRTAIRDEDYLDSPIDWRLFKAWLEME